MMGRPAERVVPVRPRARPTPRRRGRQPVDPTGGRAGDVRRVRPPDPAADARPRPSWARAGATAWRRWPGTATGTSRRTSASRAPDASSTRSTSGCRPRSWPSSSQDADDRASWSTRTSPTARAGPALVRSAAGHVIVLDDQGARHLARRCRSPTRTSSATSPSDYDRGSRSTSARRWGCATRRARPAGPRACVYTHRSTFLHALAVTSHAGMADRSGRLRAPPGPDVPRQRLGHAVRGRRGRRQAGLLRRCRSRPRPSSTCCAHERVTVTAGVPTVWLAVADELAGRGERLPDLRHIVCGGSPAAAAPDRALRATSSASASCRPGA